MIQFKATGIVSFHRIEVKPVRNWWQQFLFWWRGSIDLPVYQYEVLIHTEEDNIRYGDKVIIEIKKSMGRTALVVFHVTKVVIQFKSIVTLKTTFNTPTWLIFPDFKQANYVVTSRTAREGN